MAACWSRPPENTHWPALARAAPTSIIADEVRRPHRPHHVSYPVPGQHSHPQRMVSVSTSDPIKPLQPGPAACPGTVGIRAGDNNLQLSISRAIREPGLFAKRNQPTQHLSITDYWRRAHVRDKQLLRQVVLQSAGVHGGLASPEHRAGGRLDAQEFPFGGRADLAHPRPLPCLDLNHL